MKQTFSSVFEEVFARGRPEDTAILGIDKAPMTYARLRRHVEETVAALNFLGYGRGDRIAVMLPNGPEMATAFLGIMAGCTCAPLNPLYKENELEFYLADMRADAILLPPDPSPAALSVAGSLGIPILALAPEGEVAGAFGISGEKRQHECVPGLAGAEDVALIMHTSGTTSRPKLVPITQSSIAASAAHTAEPLGLTEGDRCLNVMPLFHVHGLIGAVVTSLVAGSSVVCTPGFQADAFLDWLIKFHPSWYTAVPTIHQHVLEQATLRPEAARMAGLRLIRSSSASLPPTVMRGLEKSFGVPVIEAYGMTEAPHQIATNPMPPRVRKEGSVGRATGLEIGILDEQWRLLGPGSTGEIALRGSRVTGGYENNPEANGKAFREGWFRTGDLGHLDAEGYLFIDGRSKEMINRGGEKVSPREVEEALLTHPAVAEAAAFPVPDPALGETVGAAIVLKMGKEASAADLVKHVSRTLAYFKVPARLWLVEAIPKGPTGKVQRVGMFDRLKAVAEARYDPPAPGSEPPATPTEKALADIWAEVLRKDSIGRHDSFFDLGGDSLLATMVVSRIGQTFDIKISIASVMDCETIAQLGEAIDRKSLGRGAHAKNPAGLKGDV